MATTTVSSGNASIDTITTTTDDATGKITERTVNMANGVVVVADFGAGGVADGVINSRTLIDTQDATGWTSKTTLYENGVIASHVVIYDNGVIETTSYEDGRRVSATLIDTQDTQSYQAIQRTYDIETGKLILTETLTDTDITLIQSGALGNVLQSTAIDEVFHGGRGVDIFKFAAPSGHDKIAHFAQGQDRLDLTAYGISTVADLDGKVTVNGRATTIQLTELDSITLIDIGPLTDADLISDGPPPAPAVVANADIATVDENATVTVDVVANDTINTASALQIDSALAPAGVSVTVDDHDLIVDTGAAFDGLADGETTTFDVDYTVSDGAGASDAGVLSVTVAGVNDDPTLAAGAGSAMEDGPSIDIDLAALGADVDSDDDGATLTYTITGAPSEGGASIDGTTLTFDPGADFQDLGVGETRDVTIEVTATDRHGATAVNDVTVTVTGENDAPVVTQAYSIPALENRSSGASLQAITLDPDGDTLTYDYGPVSSLGGSVAPSPQSGVGGFSYFAQSPSIDALAEDATASDYISFTITDGNGGETTGEIEVVLTGTNDAPVFSAETYDFGPIDENQAAGALVGQVSASDVDAGDSQYYEFANGTQTSVAFDIDRNTGEITTNAELDHETAATHALDVVVRDRDGGGLVDTAVVEVSVGDVDEGGDLDLVIVGYDISSLGTGIAILERRAIKWNRKGFPNQANCDSPYQEVDHAWTLLIGFAQTHRRFTPARSSMSANRRGLRSEPELRG